MRSAMTSALSPSTAWLLTALTAISASVMAHVSQEEFENMVAAATKMTLVDTHAMSR